MTDTRPDPDAVLAYVEASEGRPRRGRLKLFFGASAGVGKTFAMLQEAHERKKSGAEVVVGYVETHKRPETLALLEGLEELPPRWVDYRGIRLREFDLDAAIRRRPGLLLVDELAHTNAEGLRHAKRWQDVLELLGSGIDVYTTVNVQHIESLNDVIAQITGIVVRETIPDAIIERADEIELIDLPPDDLLQRFKEGKVYLPEQAGLAAERFFRKEVLVALRELSLRQTAQRVNAQVQMEKAGRAIAGIWPTAERLLVCIGPSPLSARVIRTARRMAASLRCEWIGVAVETPGASTAVRELTRRNLRLAERLGAETLTLTGENIPAEIIAYARKRNVNRIIIGKPARSRWRELLRRSIVDDLIRQSGEIDVHVVKGDIDEEPKAAAARAARPVDWRGYAWSTLVVALCTGLGWVLFRYLSPVTLTMVYLAGVVWVATRFGAGPSSAAALLAPLAFNFFFTEPYYTLEISDPQNVITFVVLLVTALVISGLAQRVRRQAETARTRYLRTIALYFMSRMLAGAASRQQVASVVARHMKDVFGGEVALLTPGRDETLEPTNDPPASFIREANESAAARWVFHNQKWAGRGTDTLPGCRGFFLPLMTSGRSLGVLGLCLPDGAEGLEPDQRHMVETFATQAAIALERAEFAEQAEQARVQAEAERLRNALLSSVSHDLRTPLATIAGASSMLVDAQERLAPQVRRELAESINEEADRLNRLIGNLLDVTRLESGALLLRREWQPLEEVIGVVLRRLDKHRASHPVHVHVPTDLPLVEIDGLLVQQVLFNLVENAMKYSPPGVSIDLNATKSPEGILVEVADRGPGLREEDRQRIFEKFYRSNVHGTSGVGLGLTVCRGIIEAHGGRIWAENRSGGGASFKFALPNVGRSPPAVPAEVPAAAARP